MFGEDWTLQSRKKGISCHREEQGERMLLVPCFRRASELWVTGVLRVGKHKLAR